MMSGLRRRVHGLLQRLLRETRGSIALNFALAVPAVAMLSVGAIDLLAVMSAKTRLQAIADAAALAAAPALGLAADDAVARGRAEAFVEAQLSQWVDAPTVEAAYEVIEQDDQRAIQVKLEGHRISFFANMLPPGGWHFEALATAAPVGKTPLCVLVIGPRTNNIDIRDSSRLMAPRCGIHSNTNIFGGNAARIEGRRIQAVGTASGPTMTTAPGEGAAPIADPFRDMRVLSQICPGGKAANLTFDGGTHYLAPGTHCRPIVVKGGTTLVLMPGDHLFQSNVRLEANARLEGEDVFLHINTLTGTPDFTAKGARVNLVGRKSGPYAGMVMASVWSGQPVLTLPGENVERLLGVVYLRTGFLQVNGTGVAAGDSAWTVIVARRVISTGTARIQINADYGSSDVPVPNGVGPNAGGLGGTGTRLVN
jgi:hypothetical protein